MDWVQVLSEEPPAGARHLLRSWISEGSQEAERRLRLELATLQEAHEATKMAHEQALADLKARPPIGTSATGNVSLAVKEALRLYDADKTLRADYALESAGAAVVNTRCTETYDQSAMKYTIFGIPVWTFVRTARAAIQPGMHPGECWAFRGSQGTLVVRLANRIRPTTFAIEHIPKELSVAGNIDSAPRQFEIFVSRTFHHEREGCRRGP